MKDCEDFTKSLAKDLYSKLFDFFIERMNSTLSTKEDIEKYNSVALLDIFGFEVLDYNNLE